MLLYPPISFSCSKLLLSRKFSHKNSVCISCLSFDLQRPAQRSFLDFIILTITGDHNHKQRLYAVSDTAHSLYRS
jgi:hypothetical protein